jgi:tRNA(Ile)-lysidine synthase
MPLYFKTMHHDPARAVFQAVRRTAREADAPMLLAVSGGLDSMALLHAMATVARARIAAVATMDHGTGPAATTAAAHVARAAAALGLPVVTERLASSEAVLGGREATWRRERYRFLRGVAETMGARVVTAHTEDDHVETVLMRVLRGSGTRGLAGLRAPSDVVRPFLHLRRETLAAYARGAGVRWKEDPSNRSRLFLRNRVRHEILPALRLADPTIDATLLDLSRRAAEWRAEVEAFVDLRLRPERAAGRSLVVGSEELSAFDRDSLAVLWGSLAGRVGLALDRRGTRRLAAFTKSKAASGNVPLSGGWCVEARRDCYVLRRQPPSSGAPAMLPEQGGIQWGAFRFHVSQGGGRAEQGAERPRDSWTAEIPIAERPIVRAWGSGDRLASAGGRERRRVKRYLSEAGVRGVDRNGWPVVLSAGGADVLWIPGVGRSDAATDRSGRPVRYYVCERIDR